VGAERVRASTEAVAAAVGLVAGGLALAPLIATVLALTTPAVRQELSSAEAGRHLTLFGMVGQFDGLDSAIGVVPVVVLLVMALLVQLVVAVGLLVTSRPGASGAWRWLPAVLMGTGVAVVVTTLLLVPVLGNADDVGNPEPAVDAPYGLTAAGWAHLTLAGGVAIAAAALIRSAREWLE
jgi:hypothetical protein